MNFLKKIFSSSVKTNQVSQIDKEENIIGLIYATTVFSHGWNDPSEIMPNQTSIILDIISTEEEIEEKLNYWNKLYYNQITQHYSIDEDQLESISEIINVPKEKYRELYAFWPNSINQDTYDKIYGKLNLKFVQYKPIDNENKNKYIIKVNERFWNIKTHNSNLLADIINTYERDFKEFELIHYSYETAMKHGIILMDRLCNQRGPDNSYYYEKAIKNQNKTFQKLPLFNYNSLKYEEEDIKQEYNRIMSEMKPELDLMKLTIEQIDSKPFEIIRIKNDK